MIRFLGNAVQAPCKIFSSDLKVRVEATDLSAFPDASVVCGEVEAPAVDAHAVSNPSLLLEVTSRSSEDYDRGDKLSHYKQLPSLMAVVFVSHRHRRVTVVSRVDAEWEEHDYRGGRARGDPDSRVYGGRRRVVRRHRSRLTDPGAIGRTSYRAPADPLTRLSSEATLGGQGRRIEGEKTKGKASERPSVAGK